MEDYDRNLLNTINTNVLDMKSECSHITGEMVGLKEGMKRCYSTSDKHNDRLRKVENTMLPVGAIVIAIVIYVIVSAMG